MANITNFTLDMINNATFHSPFTTDICMTAQGNLMPECIYKNFCPQFSGWFIKAGIVLILFYILSGWLLWAFWKFINPRLDLSELYKELKWLGPIIGDLQDHDTQVMWDIWIRQRMTHLLLAYVVITVYLSIGGTFGNLKTALFS